MHKEIDSLAHGDIAKLIATHDNATTYDPK